MCSPTATGTSTPACSPELQAAADLIRQCTALVIGAGAGLSASAGFVYEGERFDRNFADFRDAYGVPDMYRGMFHPFAAPEAFWAYMSRVILINRYMDPPLPVYAQVLRLAGNRDHFVITTNVDHCFQKAGCAPNRLFCAQGDFGLLQCEAPCCDRTWDNEAMVRAMVRRQKDMRVPADLRPRCPCRGRSLVPNLRGEQKPFVEDAAWRAAESRWHAFRDRVRRPGSRTVYLELGVGENTPGIIKYRFWDMTLENPAAAYVCINEGEAMGPKVLGDRAVYIDDDIGRALTTLLPLLEDGE